MEALSGNLLFISFLFYLAATITFAAPIVGKKWSGNAKAESGNKWSLFGYVLSIIGSLLSISYFITRWTVAGHAPVSNMYEYMTALGIAIGIAFIIIYAIYRHAILGVFTMPVVMLIIA